MPTLKWRPFFFSDNIPNNFIVNVVASLKQKESKEADWQRSDSRPVVGGAVAAVVLVGEERALDKDTWLGLETLVTSCVWLVVDDWRLRAPAPWKEVPLLKVLTTSICGRRVGQERTNGCSERQGLNGDIGWPNGWLWWSTQCLGNGTMRTRAVKGLGGLFPEWQCSEFTQIIQVLFL